MESANEDKKKDLQRFIGTLHIQRGFMIKAQQDKDEMRKEVSDLKEGFTKTLNERLPYTSLSTLSSHMRQADDQYTKLQDRVTDLE